MVSLDKVAYHGCDKGNGHDDEDAKSNTELHVGLWI